jgi:hypothetical protein
MAKNIVSVLQVANCSVAQNSSWDNLPLTFSCITKNNKETLFLINNTTYY